jgi:hypothetical protein
VGLSYGPYRFTADFQKWEDERGHEDDVCVSIYIYIWCILLDLESMCINEEKKGKKKKKKITSQDFWGKIGTKIHSY